MIPASISKYLTPAVFALVAGAGWGLAGRASCARVAEKKAHTEAVSIVSAERDTAVEQVKEVTAKAASWENRARGAEVIAKQLSQAPRITESPEGAGASVIRAGEVATRDGLLIDHALGADSDAALRAMKSGIDWERKFDGCVIERESLKKKTGFWPSVKKYGTGALIGAAVVLAVKH